jgi:DNA-binding response OmpR family regulator
MPNMNGRDLARQLGEARSGMKCLFMSGYTASVTVARGGLDAEAPFLAKPFSRRELARTVRNVLGA